MKKISILLVVILFATSCGQDLNYVNNETFEKANLILNEKLDSLEKVTTKIEKNTDTIKFQLQEIHSEQEYMSKNIDSLRYGQSAIFMYMTNSNKNRLLEILRTW